MLNGCWKHMGEEAGAVLGNQPWSPYINEKIRSPMTMFPLSPRTSLPHHPVLPVGVTWSPSSCAMAPSSRIEILGL